MQVHSNVTMYSSILDPSTILDHNLAPATNKAFLHLIMTSGYRSDQNTPLPGGAKLRVSGGGHTFELDEGDGMFVQAPSGQAGKQLTIESVGGNAAEFLLFEMS